MPRFVCPNCGRDVAGPERLEGQAADCARCGRHVLAWPAPKLGTHKPRRIRIASCSEAIVGLLLIALVGVLALIAATILVR
jgi:DNA-directed RNA polymerase subunit RPC12/RpoP